MKIHIKFILPIIILVFTSNLIGQTIVEGSEESEHLKLKNNELWYKGELFNGKKVLFIVPTQALVYQVGALFTKFGGKIYIIFRTRIIIIYISRFNQSSNY